MPSDGPDCEFDDDCDPGEVCENNICVPDVACEDDNDCDALEICNDDNECEAVQCKTDENCDFGLICSDDNIWVLDLECTENDDCDPGDICLDEVCRADPDLFCDTGLCAEDDGLRADCVGAFLACLADNVDEEECVFLSIAICTECTEDADCSGPVELTINGDFETGDGTGWSDFSGAGATFTATDTQANGGVYSGNLAAGQASAALVKQANIGIGTVQPESTVEISFDLLGSLSGDGSVVIAEFFSELSGGGVSKSEILFGPPNFPTGTWTSYSYTVTTGNDVSGSVTLQLKAECGAVAGCGVDAYFDNVSVIVESSGGVCSEGVCESSAECAVDGDCSPTGNECIDAVCNAGTCETSDNTNECDGGNGTCNAGVCEPNGAQKWCTHRTSTCSTLVASR